MNNDPLLGPMWWDDPDELEDYDQDEIQIEPELPIE